MKLISTILLCLLVLSLITKDIRADQKLLTVAIGSDLDAESRIFSFDFSFNRIPGKSSAPGNYFWISKGKNPNWVLSSSAAASIGKGVSSSANNVFFNIVLGAQQKIQKKPYAFHFELAPSISSNKDFNNGLVFADLGFKYSINQLPDFYLVPCFNAHWGNRIADGKQPDFFQRYVPSIYTEWFILTNPNKPYNPGSLEIIVKIYSIRSDETVIENGDYFWGKIAFCYRFLNNFRISMLYENGREEPEYKDNNTLKIGLDFYK